MRRKYCGGLGIIVILILLIIPTILSLKITEVELNPLGDDSANEWIELYNDEEINLNEHTIKNNDGDELSLKQIGSFSGYYVYVFSKQWLDNSDEKIFLYKDDELIDETVLLKDSENNDNTWQWCREWKFIEKTKGSENNCNKKNEEVIEKPGGKNNLSDEENNKSAELDEEYEIENVEKNKMQVIKLNAQDIKTSDDVENKYENKNKKIAVIGFFIIAVFLILLFLMKFLKDKSKSKNELV